MPLKLPEPQDLAALAAELSPEQRERMSSDDLQQFLTARFIARNLNPSGDGAVLDTLTALVVRGPLYAGDLPSKVGRSELVEHGLAISTVNAGEDGYTAITYLGRDVFIHLWSPDNPNVSLGKANANYWKHKTKQREAAAAAE